MELSNQRTDSTKQSPRRALTSFPFNKSVSKCNCGKYELKDIPQLWRVLPEGYDYKLCDYIELDNENQFHVTLRMRLTSKEEALEWKRLFEEKSLTTHVLDKSFPKVGRVSVFKVQYRCQFFDRRKTKNKLQTPEKSKFRDCHSILFINIKKFFKNTVDEHMPKYCTVLRLHYAHNHPLDTADVLRKRGLNPDIQQRFLEMYQHGTKPKDALDTHKRELLEKLGTEKYRQVVCDGYYVPNLAKVYRLYYQFHGKGVSAKTNTKRSSRHNPSADWLAFQTCPGITPAYEAENNEGNSGADFGGCGPCCGDENNDNDGCLDDTYEDASTKQSKTGQLRTEGRDIVSFSFQSNGNLETCKEQIASFTNDIVGRTASASYVTETHAQCLQYRSSSSHVLPGLEERPSNYCTGIVDSNAQHEYIKPPGSQDNQKAQELTIAPSNASDTFSTSNMESNDIIFDTHGSHNKDLNHPLHMDDQKAKTSLSNNYHQHKELRPFTFSLIQTLPSRTPNSTVHNYPTIVLTATTSTITTVTATSSIRGGDCHQYSQSHPIQAPRPLHLTQPCNQVSHLPMHQHIIPQPSLSSQSEVSSIVHLTQSSTFHSPVPPLSLNKVGQTFVTNGHLSSSSCEIDPTTSLAIPFFSMPSETSNLAPSSLDSLSRCSVNSSSYYIHHHNHQQQTLPQHTVQDNIAVLDETSSCTDKALRKPDFNIHSRLPLAQAPVSNPSLHPISSDTISAIKPAKVICTANIAQASSILCSRPITKTRTKKSRNPRTRQKPKSKLNSSKVINIKLVTKRWLEQKPKVDVETQNLASELMGNILLKEKAEKLKARLLTFLSELQGKLTSNPKLFVPAVEKFIQAGESAKDDSHLTALLRDFGKTDESSSCEQLKRSQKVISTKGCQTQFSQCERSCVKTNFVTSGAKVNRHSRIRSSRINSFRKNLDFYQLLGSNTT